MLKNKVLKEWKAENPNVNPFSGCQNIVALGGADLYWEEFSYRYGDREIFNVDNFVRAVERVFLYNRYKYARLLETTTATYNMFDNYKVEKSGSEATSGSSNTENGGRDTFINGKTVTETDTRVREIETSHGAKSETTTLAPVKETVTPQTTEITDFTPRVKTQETTKKGQTVTVETTPSDYVDTLSRTTYDSTNFTGVSKTAHNVDNAEKVETSFDPSGSDTVTTEYLKDGSTELKNTTKTSYEQGSKIETVTELTGESPQNVVSTAYDAPDKTTEQIKNGKLIRANSGTDTQTFGKTVDQTTSETLTFNNRIDSGYMYREPQNAIKDEREIAYFAVLNEVLSDVERATLLSIYLY